MCYHGEIIQRSEKIYQLTVEQHFDAAHFLRSYKGKCEEIHGHRFRAVVRVRSNQLDEIGNPECRRGCDDDDADNDSEEFLYEHSTSLVACRQQW